MTTARRLSLSLFLMVLTLPTAAFAAGTSFRFTELTRTFQPAPVPAKISFVYPFSSNDQKQVAFIADGALFLRSQGKTSLLVGLGTPAPGGGTFLGADTPSINSVGEIVFRGNAAAPSSSGLFLYSSGTITQIVQDLAQSTSGDVVYPTKPSLAENGTVVFLSFTQNGLFAVSNGIISRLFAVGDSTPTGDTFLNFQSCAINKNGDIVFTAFLFSGNRAIFLESGGTLTKVVSSGDVLPGGAIVFTFLGDPSLNDLGQVAVAGLANGAATDSGVYLYSNGGLTIPVPAFSPAPDGGLFTIINSAALNNLGQIAFTGQTSNDSNGQESLFLLSNGLIAQLTAPGQISPGGDKFTSPFGTLALDSAGRVVFTSRLKQHSDGLFRFNGAKVLRIAGQGDPVQSKPAFIFPVAYGLGSQRVLLFGSTFPGGTGLFSASKSNPTDVKLVAHDGQNFRAEGAIEGFFENFETNSKGDIVFNSDLSGGHSFIFHRAPGQNLAPIVKASFDGTGDISPDGSPFLGVRQVSVNDLGQIGFAAFTQLHGGIYLSMNGLISLAVDDNSVLPDGSGTLGAVSSHALNHAGQIAFFAQSFPVANGMYLLSSGQLTALARDGSPAPGGGLYSLGYPDPAYGPSLDSTGDVAFSADLSTGGRAVFLWSQGVVRRIAGPADSVPRGGSFSSVDSPRLNAGGQLVFFGETSDGRFGAFLYSQGTISKIALSGDPAALGGTLTFVGSPFINDAGEVAFGVDLSDGTASTYVAVPVAVASQPGSLSKTTSLPQHRTPAAVYRSFHPHPKTHIPVGGSSSTRGL